MNQILVKYNLKQFAWIFFATLFILTTVVGLFDLIELLRQAAKGETAGFFDALTMAVLKSPQMIHIILPFVILLSGLIFFSLFNKSSELIVMRAVGLSVWDILKPLAILVFAIGLFDTLAFSPIAAWTARRYERMEERMGMTHSTPMVWSEEGFWLKEQTDTGEIIVHASQVSQIKDRVILKNVSLFELAPDSTTFLRQIESVKATLKNGRLILKKAMIIDPVNESAQEVPIQSFDTSLTLERILEKFDDPQTMSFWRFPRFIQFLQESGFSAIQHQMYFHELIAFPALLVAMLLIAAVFAMPSGNRQGKIFFRMLGAIGMGFILYFFTRVTNVLGLSGNLPFMLAAWGPVLIAIPLCLSALLHLEDG
ncbi:MAG: LptF/LptG family permease [Alphaproteobacteria bacterium]|nr:LptF/LptG family permease [Alphaproteobacteria bacterium]